MGKAFFSELSVNVPRELKDLYQAIRNCYVDNNIDFVKLF